jgi:hypothetical protein
MKKIILYSAVLFLVGVSSCSEEWLEVEPKGTTLEANYYKNANEAFAGLVAAYDPLGTEWVNIYASKVGLLNCASDDCWAGGAAFNDQVTWESWNNYTLDAGVGPQESFWGRNFTGINRANTILSKLDGVPMDEVLKERFKAEAKFLRAYYYFDLVRLFRNVPLFTSLLSPSEFFDAQQASPEEVYAQIEIDLNEAIPNLPLTVPQDENGRVTKMAATALLGKVILFQNDEGRMLEAAELFRQVNTSGIYELLDNYADIFRPDNKFNQESIFEITHTSAAIGYWSFPPAGEGNLLVQLCGPRAYSGPVYSAGWGFNPILPELVELLRSSHRYNGTVANIDSIAKAGAASYEKGYQNTGYFMQKFAPLKEFMSSGGGDPVLEWPDNYIEIRLADTYLMEAEALVRGGNPAAAQEWLDKVRARVGLDPVPATLENIYNERRVELATEGHRWFDLIRTGKAAEVLAFKGFVAGKHELLPIPLSELGNTKLKQNPNY